MSRNFIRWYFWMAVIPALLSSQSRDQESKAVYREAQSFFLKANQKAEEDPAAARELYQKAATFFESLYVTQGIKNGKLFYNIGNAYFRAGFIGKAILYYKNALRYIPNDENLSKNLEFVRSKRIDQIKEREKQKILKIIFFWHYRIAPNYKLNLFVISFILIWLWASLMLGTRWKIWRRLLIFTVLFSAVFMVSYSADLLSHILNREGVIVTESVVGRKGDGITYQPSFNEPLHEGTEFYLIEKRRDWFNIELSDGKRCWIPAKSSELILDK